MACVLRGWVCSGGVVCGEESCFFMTATSYERRKPTARQMCYHHALHFFNFLLAALASRWARVALCLAFSMSLRILAILA